jgi:hypothetical protein
MPQEALSEGHPMQAAMRRGTLAQRVSLQILFPRGNIYLQEYILPDTAERRHAMAIFHFTIKIVGRSKGKSIISASAYLNGDVMKNYENGKVSYYTSKSEVVYTRLMMCENAPPEWEHVPDEAVKRFMKSVRYKRAEDKTAALEKFMITYRKQKLWNEVLKIETDTNAQLGRAIEFSLPVEWSRQEQIDYTTEFIQRSFVNNGMCADWSIHDKGDGNPHVHLLLTMRPFQEDHTWGKKEVKDWEFLRDDNGNIIIDESHPDWWQDKKDPDRHGIRIPVLDENGIQKVGARNRKQWKRVLTDTTGWNNPKNCEFWRSEWEKECNSHLPQEKWIDHRSYERQGKAQIPTIHEGAEARKIDEKYRNGIIASPSWKIDENRIIKRQNAILRRLEEKFVTLTDKLSQWKGRINDIREQHGDHTHDGGNDHTDRGTAGAIGRDVPRDEGARGAAPTLPGTEQAIAGIKHRVERAASKLAGYRRNAVRHGKAGYPDHRTENSESAVDRIGREVEQRERLIAATESAIIESKQQLEKARNVDERIKKIKARRAEQGTAVTSGKYADRIRPEGSGNRGSEDAAKRIDGISREIEQREQSRERISLKERLDAKKRIVAERENEAEKSRGHNRGISR